LAYREFDNTARVESDRRASRDDDAGRNDVLRRKNERDRDTKFLGQLGTYRTARQRVRLVCADGGRQRRIRAHQKQERKQDKTAWNHFRPHVRVGAPGPHFAEFDGYNDHRVTAKLEKPGERSFNDWEEKNALGTAQAIWCHELGQIRQSAARMSETCCCTVIVMRTRCNSLMLDLSSERALRRVA
jgi:hypothetical protein